MALVVFALLSVALPVATMPSPLLLVPALLLPALSLTGCTGGEGDADYALTITPVLPRNQGALLSELDRMDLVLDDGSDSPPSYELSGISEGDSSTFEELPALQGTVLELRGYVGNKLSAYGRTEPLTLETGSLDVRVLVSAVDQFAELSPLPDVVAFGAVAAGGSGRFLLFGGNEEGVFSKEASSAIYAVDVAPPTDSLLFEELSVEMPPRDDGGEGRMCHSATALTQGDHDKIGQILVAGGAEVFMFEEDNSYAVDLSTVTLSSFLYDPTTDTVDPLSDSRTLVRERCGHTATELPSGDVVLVGGMGRAELGLIAQQSAEIYNPVIGGFESVDGDPDGPFVFHAAAALGDEGVLVCGGLERSGSAWQASIACDLVSASGSISSAGDGPAALIHAAMAPLPGGRVLLAGGAQPTGTSAKYSFPSDVTNQAWIYEDGSWEEADDSMSMPRAMHQMIALPDGDVLVVGGVTEIGEFWNIVYGSSFAVPCAEVYDADTGRFAVVGDCNVDDNIGPLPAAVALPGVALDPDYGVLVAGGLSPDEEGSDGASIYVPTP